MPCYKFEIKNAIEGEKIDKIFYNLKWLTPFEYYKSSSKEAFLLKETKDFINLNKDNLKKIICNIFKHYNFTTKNFLYNPHNINQIIYK